MDAEYADQLLNGRCIAILGAGGDIGIDVAKYLSLQGSDLILFTKTHDEKFIEETSSLHSVHHNILGIYEVDLEDILSVKAAIDVITRRELQIDGIVIASGVANGSLFEMTSQSDLKRIFDINFFGPLKFVQGVIRILRKKPTSSIVFVTSVAGLDPKRGNISYGTSKAALNFAVQILSVENATYNLRINAVAPGLVNTRMLTNMDPKAKQEVLDTTSLGRTAEPREISKVIAFLLSEMSSHITGQIVRVDGGRK